MDLPVAASVFIGCAGWNLPRASSVPPGFLFSVELPKAITHEKRPSDCDGLLTHFLTQAAVLGDKLLIRPDSV